METKEAVLIMRFPESVKEALREAAEADQRSMSALVLKVVSEYLTAEGYLPHQKHQRRGRRV